MSNHFDTLQKMLEEGEYGTWKELTSVGDTVGGFTCISCEYSHIYKWSVIFAVVVSDPDGKLWQFTYDHGVGDRDDYAHETSLIPVSAKYEMVKTLKFVPRVARRK